MQSYSVNVSIYFLRIEWKFKSEGLRHNCKIHSFRNFMPLSSVNRPFPPKFAAKPHDSTKMSSTNVHSHYALFDTKTDRSLSFIPEYIQQRATISNGINLNVACSVQLNIVHAGAVMIIFGTASALPQVKLFWIIQMWN